MSPEAARLLNILRHMPGTYTIEELAGTLRTSKTKVRNALWELEDNNFIRIEEVE